MKIEYIFWIFWIICDIVIGKSDIFMGVSNFAENIACNFHQSLHNCDRYDLWLEMGQVVC